MLISPCQTYQGGLCRYTVAIFACGSCAGGRAAHPPRPTEQWGGCVGGKEQIRTGVHTSAVIAVRETLSKCATTVHRNHQTEEAPEGAAASTSLPRPRGCDVQKSVNAVSGRKTSARGAWKARGWITDADGWNRWMMDYEWPHLLIEKGRG